MRIQEQRARQRSLILALLLILAAAAWALLFWQSTMMSGMGLTMGLGIGVFLAVWVVMMVAMMVPAIAPMTLAFARIQRERPDGRPVFVSTGIFVGAYLFVWTLFGALSYLGANAATDLAQRMPWLMMNAPRIGGGVLVLAGLYQFTPVKRACLAKCCKPEQFLLDGWRDGSAGAVRMGWEHGLTCLGANWLLFVLLFAVGLMNLAAMAVLTALIVAEKMLPQAGRIAQVAGLVLIVYGLLVIVVPAALPRGGSGM